MFDLSLFDGNRELTELSDEKLAAYIKMWKNNSFDVIYNRWKDKIYNYVLVFLNYNKEDAINVCGNVFVKIFNYAKTKEINSVKSLLYRIAHNESVNYISLKKSETNSFLDENTEDINDIKKKDDINKSYKQKILTCLLKKLDERYRWVIYLYYFEEKDYNEIAYIIWSNKNSVWTLISRGKNKLKELIEEYKLNDTFLLN